MGLKRWLKTAFGVAHTEADVEAAQRRYDFKQARGEYRAITPADMDVLDAAAYHQRVGEPVPAALEEARQRIRAKQKTL